jgi:hypothetical protein
VGALPLTLKDLPSYIGEFNSTHAKKVLLHIYLAPGHESRDIAVPVVLRFLIPNVLRAFIILGHEEGIDHVVSETPALMVESLTVFGSREKASASYDDRKGCLFIDCGLETSSFAVRIHHLSEAISMGCARVTIVTPSALTKLHCENCPDTNLIDSPAADFFSLVVPSDPLKRGDPGIASEQDMLVAYESLFLEKCSLCSRFLSAEGYLPPVARVRQEDGTWEPQHGTCVQT